MKRLAPFAFAAPLAVFCLTAAFPSKGRNDSIQVGQVNFPTSCTADAGAKVETGVALLHSFQYEEAEQTFSDAAKRDPKCAMAYWGKAMTRYEQLWEFPHGKSLKQGLEEIQQARAVNPNNTRERGYIAAAAAFYSDDSKLSHKQRIQNYSSALDQLRKEAPQDVNAGAFYALSLVALAEEENGESSDNQNRKAAIALLETLCRNAPKNPGPAHYLIHATDTPQLAPLGLEAARSYAKIAPDSSHALHMPSHIFVRLGLWQESIASNIAAAAAAAKATEEHRADAHYQFHAMDFLNYSYLQSGEESKARALLEELKKVPGASADGIAEHQADFSARNAFELHRWKEAAALPIPDTDREEQRMTYRALAIGAARSGNPEAARKDFAKYKELSSSHRHHGDRAPSSDSQEKGIGEVEAEAWVTYAEEKPDEALKMLRSAADREDAKGVDSLAMPAREMLADMLLESRRPSDALKEYQAALKNSPNRFDSLYGAARSAQAAGDTAAARVYFANLLSVCATSADRPELAEAKAASGWPAH
jgi:tetratricopeptide (TPR) repeat protein